MNGTEPVRAALWARVSTSDQKTANQVDVLRDWAQRRGLDIAVEFITEDSAWQNGNGAKGKEFDRTRDELINGARLGHYTVVLVWAVDRLSRRGIEDTLATMRRLYEHGCDIWSHQEPWLVTSEPRSGSCSCPSWPGWPSRRVHGALSASRPGWSAASARASPSAAG